MRTEWYGDKKDVVNWVSLLSFAKRKGIKHIFYVVMCTDTIQDMPNEGNPYERAVAEFFDRHKDLRRTKELGMGHGIRINVWMKQFSNEGRAAYFKEVHKKMRASKRRTVWFFDPDTGIKPRSQRGEKYVNEEDLKCAVEALKPGHYLACYQHSQKQSDPRWQNTNRKKLARASCKKVSDVKMFTSNYSNEAIILAVRKT